MLTGDARTSALAIGRELGLGEADVVSEVLPKDKARVVEDLEAKGEIVAMAGDGINDAPALVSASVGIAMGAGSDIAIESAGVTLVNGDLRAVARALTLGRKTMRNIRENLGLAFGLQPPRHPRRRRRALSGVRHRPHPDARGGGDELQLGLGDHERTAPPVGRPPRVTAGARGSAREHVGGRATTALRSTPCGLLVARGHRSRRCTAPTLVAKHLACVVLFRKPSAPRRREARRVT
jgi:hypothetical protein